MHATSWLLAVLVASLPMGVWALEGAPSVSLAVGAVGSVDPGRAGPAAAIRVGLPVGRGLEGEVDVTGWTLSSSGRSEAVTEWALGAGLSGRRGGESEGPFLRWAAGPALVVRDRWREDAGLTWGLYAAPTAGWQSRRPTLRYEATLKALATGEGARAGLFLGASYAFH